MRFFIAFSATLLIGLLPWQVEAFEIFSEYRSLTVEQSKSFDWPSNIDSEYSSDLLAFEPSILWDRHRWQQQSHGQMALGSLNGHEFFTRRYLQMRQDITSHLSGKLLYFEQGDLDGHEDHFIVEAEYSVSNNWAVVTYAELAHLKAESDLGTAIVWRPGPAHELRFYRTWVDFDRNIRTRGSDRFTVYPEVYGLSGRYLPKTSNDEFVAYSIRLEPEAQWRFWDVGEDYRYWQKSISSQGVIGPQSGGRWLFRQLWDQKFEGRYEIVSNSELGSVQRDRYLGLLQYESFQSSEYFTSVTYGLAMGIRQWRVNKDRELVFQQLLPHLNVQLSANSMKNLGRAWWQIGVEMTDHQSFGDQTLRSVYVKQSAQEYRLNFWWNWQFNEQGMFVLAMTADLDQLLSPVAFEGGGAFLHMAF